MKVWVDIPVMIGGIRARLTYSSRLDGPPPPGSKKKKVDRYLLA